MIRVEGLSLERFLNLATAEGVGVYGVRRASYTVLKAEVTARGYRKLKRVVPEKYALTAERQGGLPFALRTLTLRMALLIGLLLVAAGLLAGSLFVWDVRVEGLEYREARALKEEMAAMGICPGAWKGDIDEDGAGTKLLIAHEEFAWIDIRIEGVVALVKVVPADLAPEVYDENTPQSIIATKDALIARVTPLAGRAAVKKGDTVRAGDVLISGMVWDEGKPRMLFAARGEVIGSVWYAGGASSSIYTEVRVPTGRTYSQRVISIGGDSSDVEPDCEFADYDTRVVEKINIGLFLPVYITEYEYSEVTLVTEPKGFEALSVCLEEAAYFDALRGVPEDAEIAGHHAIFRLDGCVMSATVYIHTYEDIGRAVILED
jgi:similar to stage IV sporulation protein